MVNHRYCEKWWIELWLGDNQQRRKKHLVGQKAKTNSFPDPTMTKSIHSNLLCQITVIERERTSDHSIDHPNRFVLIRDGARCGRSENTLSGSCLQCASHTNAHTHAHKHERDSSHNAMRLQHAFAFAAQHEKRCQNEYENRFFGNSLKRK